MSSTAISPLGPIDPKHAVPENEQETEQKAPWIIRKLVGVRFIAGPAFPTIRAQTTYSAYSL